VGREEEEQQEQEMVVVAGAWRRHVGVIGP